MVGVYDASFWMENLPFRLPQYWLSGNRIPEIPGAFRLKAAKVALYVVLSVLIELGYTNGIKKSVLAPTTSLEYLGLTVDSEKQSFLIL